MRTFLRPLALAAISLLATLAFAQDYPTRPVKLVVPQATGSGGDIVARLMADHMSKDLGQTVFVDNKPGANGIVGSADVAHAAPDGYTIELTSVSIAAFNQFMYKSVPYDAMKDFTYIAPVADASFLVVASTKSGIKTWDDFVKKAKANPDTLTFGSAGAGNSTHLYMEMIGRKAGLKLRHIPYKGSAPALMSIVAGETDVMVVPTVVAFAQLQAGKLVALAQSGDKRSPKMPDIPLLKELNADVPPLPGWYAVVGPAKMDPKVVQKLAAAVNAFLKDPAMAAKLNDQYLQPIPGTPEGIQRRAEQEAKVWGGLIRELNIQAD
jgi:tripartite-type tricarboxylate transporter receptor subunit TctC